MSKTAESSGVRSYFSASEERIERWRELHQIAKELAAGQPSDRLRSEATATLSRLEPLEELCGYPGPRLMALVQERLKSSDWKGFGRLAQRISISLLSNSYRDDPEAWKSDDEEDDAHMPSALPPSIGRGQARKPYCEVLVVTPGERATWDATREGFRKLRRDADAFVYEPIVVGSFEDALLASLVNFNIQALVVYDGFGYSSQTSLPDLRELIGAYMPQAAAARGGDLAMLLSRAVHAIRPELDIYLATDRDVGKLAGAEEAASVRRVFYGLEEMLEMHLAIMDGLQDRYSTPYFDNLKKYAQRPIGTFHALPVARGKSIFKSNWIRDMGEFYGANLFLAESSATTGGLDSLLEPTGNIKVAQEKAARAFGSDHAFFVTNGTSTSNKIIHMAVCRPGDIVLIDRDCHKSHHYGLVLAGAQPYYIDAFPLTQYSMYGSLAIKPITDALKQLKAEGKLDKVRMLVLTNCTFDGHVANVEQTMLECLAIKPDLIFLWDEAWFGFARFSPFLRRRTAMGGVAKLRTLFKSPEYKKRFQESKGALPDPDKARIRVYESDSVHKSMSCLRQGSIIVVADQDFHTVEA
ncbi:MAG TPA: aminotransferase class I/II-fold pyridoxal phosphate-dependent enzyme, partial [Burkholderiales bacterium]